MWATHALTPVWDVTGNFLAECILQQFNYITVVPPIV